MIYISDALEELERVAERCTVLRDSKTVFRGRMAETTRPQLVEAMVGRQLEQAFPKTPHAIGETLLELRGVSGKPLPHDVSPTLRHGEILPRRVQEARPEQRHGRASEARRTLACGTTERSS